MQPEVADGLPPGVGGRGYEATRAVRHHGDRHHLGGQAGIIQADGAGRSGANGELTGPESVDHTRARSADHPDLDQTGRFPGQPARW